MAKKEQILELLNAYKSEVDNFNDAVFTDKFEALAQDIVKLFAIPVVVGRSEQLVCPACKSRNIEIRHKQQSFRCNDCKEGWAN
jgi:transposase-like protein